MREAMDEVRKNKLKIVAPADEPKLYTTREFDYPRELVWRVYTDGPLMARWWGPSKYVTIVHEFDFRDGGKWRVDNATPDGKEVHHFHGVFSNIRPIDEFTWTFGYADWPAGPETYRFLDLGNGRTRLEAVSVFPDMKTREMVVSSGMEAGATETYHRLEDLLAEVAAETGGG